jgi:DNA-binding transcriptional MerR regulator
MYRRLTEACRTDPEEVAVSRRMTIEELAAASGMTVRNVREHQTRGLVPPPALVGRKGYYDDRHLARLQLIRQLQDEGLNLQAVGWLLEQVPPEATDEAERLKQALFAPWVTEAPRVYTVDELVARFGPDAAARDRTEQLGLLRELGDGRWESPAPRLVEAGAQLVELGVEVDRALDVLEQLLTSLSAVASSFVDLFLAEIVAPPGEAATPAAERTAAIRDAVERLRPVASEAVLAGFQLRMDELVSTTFGPTAP